MHDLDQYAFAGFLLTRPYPLPSHDGSLDGQTSVSLSSCLAKPLLCADALGWAISGDLSGRDANTAAETYGLDAALLEKLANELFHANLVKDWRLVQSEQAVATFLRALPRIPTLRVIGTGVHFDDIQLLIDARESGPTLDDVLPLRRPFPAGGVPLGLELHVYDYGFHAHSWVCNGIHDSARLRGMALTPDQFLTSRKDAVGLTAELNSGELRAEPGRWTPWLLVDYTAHFAQRR